MGHAIVGLRLKVLCMIGIFIYNPYHFQVFWYSKKKLSYLFHENRLHQQQKYFLFKYWPCIHFVTYLSEKIHLMVYIIRLTIRSLINHKKCQKIMFILHKSIMLNVNGTQGQMVNYNIIRSQKISLGYAEVYICRLSAFGVSNIHIYA